jgi:TRAP-type C4-dicarboxylate transport system permease small subunit
MEQTGESNTSGTSKLLFWIGVVLSALPVLMLTMSAIMKFVKPQPLIDGFAKMGWPDHLALGLGIVETICTILYVIPRSAALGAILLTGYLGGAIATHLRIGESIVFPIVLGVMIWGGLYLRDPRIRAVIPFRLE